MKIAPHMNTKAIGEYVAATNLCADFRCLASTDWTYAHGKEQLKFYFQPFPFTSATSYGSTGTVGSAAGPKDPTLPFIGINHGSAVGIASEMARAHPGAICWMPRQSVFTTFIMMTEEMDKKYDPGGHGLVRCPSPT
jgi:hypothetical protein